MLSRQFLVLFQLPGEAQKIDRIMQAFADAYYAHSDKKVFADAGISVALSYLTKKRLFMCWHFRLSC